MVEELWARDFSDPVYFRNHRMLVDAFCLQHPDRYCASAKSLAAHLCGLCCACERGGEVNLLKALQRWLSGRTGIVKPELPSSHGVLTVAEVYAADGPVAHAGAVERWARSTWDAYSSLHPLARRWLDQAAGAA